jgi:DNA modification methylase
MTGRALVVQANALRLPLPDECVDLIVTSPPYWSLRKYAESCRICEDVIASGGDPLTAFDPGWDDHVARFHHGIGNEATPLGWLEALWAATAEMKRVLKPTGSIFVNLGDCYASTTKGSGGTARSTLGAASGGHGMSAEAHAKTLARSQYPPRRYDMPVPQKSLLGLPYAYVLGCSGMLAQLGGPDPGLNLICRRDLIWQKVNGLPESVTDRARSSHEYIFHLTKQPRYYAALDTLREPHEHHRRDAWDRRNGNPDDQTDARMGNHPLGKLPGSVWSIPSDPLRLPAWLGTEHYASFPAELPRRIILGWSPPGVCVECGQGRWPVVDRRSPDDFGPRQDGRNRQRQGNGPPGNGLNVQPTTILGWACSCTPSTLHPGTGEPSGPDKRYGDYLQDGGYPHQEENSNGRGATSLQNRPKVGPWREYHLTAWKPPPTTPAVVLDPFGGVGTTCLTARALGRIGISADLSHAYSRAAKWRVFESGEWQDIIAKTTGRKVKPLPKHDPAQPRLL